MSNTVVTENLWSAIKSEFRKRFPQELFDTWFAPVVSREENDGSLVLIAPNAFAAIWLEDNYLDLIREEAARQSDSIVEVSITVEDENSPDAPTPRATLPEPARASPRVQQAAERRSHPNLNPRNTFDNFIVGSSNELAHAASLAVGSAPGKSYNPLFLYGDTGLGKTHLMHAISHAILKRDPAARVHYVSCEQFTNDFMHAIQENSLLKFRRKYRDVDILLIDDIQFLERKERTQEEFFHTFNELFESGRQICLSSDRPANEIPKLEARLVSRFQWGMVTDIQAPDLETRTAILRKKALALNFSIPNDILTFLAQRITKNVRRMEGALIKVATASTLSKNPLDLASVERLIHDILQEEEANQITIEKIQKKVCEYYELRLSDMLSKRRPNQIAFPRQIAMYLSRLLTNQPLKDIGEAFGGRDHGTVIHACKAVENAMEQNETVRRNVEFLIKQLGSPLPQLL